MKYLLKAFCVFLAAAASALALQASPVLPHLFSDHMVLQRDMPISVWGRADASEQIIVTLAEQSAHTVSGADGRWKVALAPMAGGGPRGGAYPNDSLAAPASAPMMGSAENGRMNMDACPMMSNGNCPMTSQQHPGGKC